MIAKKYRLSEHELRKVFACKKPFFSYVFVANIRKNHLWYARLGILLSSKTTPGSVNRNYFRRIFYNASKEILPHGYDIVFVVKKGKKFSHKKPEDRLEFEKNLHFIYQKFLSSLCNFWE